MLNSLCAGMLRCSGNMHVPSILNIGLCLLDVVFNWLLIFPSRTYFGITIPGAGLGVVGAVLGTAIAFIICSSLMCYFTVVRSKELSLRQDSGTFIPQRSTLRESFHIAAPIAVEHVILCGAQIVSTIIVAPLGTVAIAANSFGITIEALCYMPGYGISDAATTLVGQSLGAGRRFLARSFGRITLGMGMTFMTLMAVVMYCCSPALMSIMTPDVEVERLTVQILRIEDGAHCPGLDTCWHDGAARRLDCYGDGALLPRHHLPHQIPRRRLAEEVLSAGSQISLIRPVS